MHVNQNYQQLQFLWKNCMILQVILTWVTDIQLIILVHRKRNLLLPCSWISFSAFATVDGKLLLCVTVQKRGYMDLQGTSREDIMSCCYGTTLQKDPTCTMACSWTSTDPSTFLIRGKNYLQDRQKVWIVNKKDATV